MIPSGLVTLLAIVMTAFLPRLLRRLIRPSGHCCCCGYSLTGIRSDRCPECGTGMKEATQPDVAVIQAICLARGLAVAVVIATVGVNVARHLPAARPETEWAVRLIPMDPVYRNVTLSGREIIEATLTTNDDQEHQTSFPAGAPAIDVTRWLESLELERTDVPEAQLAEANTIAHYLRQMNVLGWVGDGPPPGPGIRRAFCGRYANLRVFSAPVSGSAPIFLILTLAAIGGGLANASTYRRAMRWVSAEEVPGAG